MRSNFGRRLRQPHRASTLTKLYRARLNVANSTTGSRSNVSSDTWSFDLATRQLEPELATESAAARQAWEEEKKSKVGGRDDNDTRPSIAAPPTQAIKVIRFRPSQFSLSISLLPPDCDKSRGYNCPPVLVYFGPTLTVRPGGNGRTGTTQATESPLRGTTYNLVSILVNKPIIWLWQVAECGRGNRSWSWSWSLSLSSSLQLESEEWK